MVSCVVRGCRGRSSHRISGVKFYSFPKNLQLQNKWRKFCDTTKTLNLRTARICSRHFEDKYYYKRSIDIALGLSCPSRFRNLVSDAIPTLNGPNVGPSNPDESIEEIEGEQENHEIVEVIGIQSHDSGSTSLCSESTTSPCEVLKSSVYSLADENIQVVYLPKQSQVNESEEKIHRLTEENQKLQFELSLLKTNTVGAVKRLQERVKKIEERNKTLERENSTLKNDKILLEEKFKNHTILLKQYFSTGQLRRMFCDDPNKRLRWTVDDIASAISLKSESSQAYDFLRSKLSFLLPDPSTLRRWIRKKNAFLANRDFSDTDKPLSESDRAIKNLLLLNDQSEVPIEIDQNDSDNDNSNNLEDDLDVVCET